MIKALTNISFISRTAIIGAGTAMLLFGTSQAFAQQDTQVRSQEDQKISRESLSF